MPVCFTVYRDRSVGRLWRLIIEVGDESGRSDRATALAATPATAREIALYRPAMAAAKLPAPPRLSIGVPYADVRRRLIGRGLLPQRVMYSDLGAKAPDAQAYPEYQHCVRDQPVCLMVYRRANGDFWRVRARADPSRHDEYRLTFDGMKRIDDQEQMLLYLSTTAGPAV